MRPETTHDRLRQQIVSLAAGELSPLAAWRLRRHLARCPHCTREYAAIRTLWADLAGLPPVAPSRPAPLWAAIDAVPGQATPTVTVGGLTMKRRTVLTACALVCFSVTGVAVAHYLHYEPTRDFSDGHGHLWRADMGFRGEVKLYDRDGRSMGSHGSDGPANGPVSATVTVDGFSYPVSGAGRHELRDASGALLGYAELVPETDAERKRWWSEYEHRGGIQERLRNIGVGATDGWGTAVGEFGSEPHRLSWRLNGVGRINFYRADNGHLVYFANAGAIDTSDLPNVRRRLAPDAYATLVDEAPPAVPIFTWTFDGQTYTHHGTDPFPLTLPNGVRLTVRVAPGDGAERPVTVSSAVTGPGGGTGHGDDRSDYERRGGVQERLHISYGERDGYGRAEGFFGSAPDRLDWKLVGMARILFRRADNGRLVYYATAQPPRIVDAPAPAVPTFSWTAGDVTYDHTGYDRFPMALPDGTPLMVEVLPLSDHVTD